MVPYKNFSYNSEINLEEKIFSKGKNTMKTRMIHTAIERSQTQPVTIIIVITAVICKVCKKHVQKKQQREEHNKFISCICKFMKYFKVFPEDLYQ